jgi:cytochrome c2
MLMKKLACLMLALTIPLTAAAAPGDLLDFRRGGETVASFSRQQLAARCGREKVTVADPYYETEKTFYATSLSCVLELGFGAPPEAWGDREIIFQALDGYARSATAETLRREGGFLALGDAGEAVWPEVSWAPIGREKTDPGPFYVIWNQSGQQDPHLYPWPYQLSVVEMKSVVDAYPHTAPTGLAAEHPAWRGHEIFLRDCLTCHAINGDGGVVGPELNLPQSIVEYRDIEQLKTFVRNPQEFRYTKMPANNHLSNADLADLVAYFQVMKDRKNDPKDRS